MICPTCKVIKMIEDEAVKVFRCPNPNCRTVLCKADVVGLMVAQAEQVIADAKNFLGQSPEPDHVIHQVRS